MKRFFSLPDYFPYAIRLALSAWISFAIAASLHVENAFWAAMPVWVIAQSTRGLLIERAIYRIIGTLIGATFAISLLHLSIHPLLLIICLGLWSALCSAATHMIRGVRSYGTLMAGMTASVVILPTLLHLDATTDYAYARVECTLIGVIVATFIMSGGTPKSSLTDFYGRIIQLTKDVIQFAEQILTSGETPDMPVKAKQILMAISEIDDAARVVSAGSITGYRRLQYVDIFISASLAVMASSLTISRRHQSHQPVSPDILALLNPAALAQFNIKKNPLPHRDTLLRTSPDQRLKNALTLLMGIQAILTDTKKQPEKQLSVSEKLHYLAPYRNWRKALITAFITGCATFFAGACVLMTGIQEIALAALGISMFTMLLSSLPLPKKAAPFILIGVTMGVIMAIIYRLLIQPHITNWSELVLSIIPFIIIGALARANKKTAIPAIDANMCFLLGSQAGAIAKHLPYVLLESGALWIGAFIVTLSFILAPQNMKRSAQYWKDRIVNDIASLLTTGAQYRWHSTAARYVLRLIQDLRRASLLENAPVGLLDALNLGYTIDQLRSFDETNPSAYAEAQQVLTLLQDFMQNPQSTAKTIQQYLPDITHNEIQVLARDAQIALENGHAFLTVTHQFQTAS